MNEAHLVLFTRNLRLVDNRPLHGIKQAQLWFVFDPRQNGPSSSEPARKFMLECVSNLQKEVQLHVLQGLPHVLILEYKKTLPKNARLIVHMAKEYSPFGKIRAAEIQQVCELIETDDFSLVHPTQLQLYRKFTPYYKVVLTFLTENFDALRPTKKVKIANEVLPKALAKYRYVIPEASVHHRKCALKILLGSADFKQYEKTRNIMSKPSTRLSHRLKFGVVSIREVFFAFGKNASLIRELIFRDFYYQYFALNSPFPTRLVAWNAPTLLDKWTSGCTGIPIIDAGIRQLLQTGWMHNRVRMIVASFLVKNLLIDWRLGERFFAKHLIDYDPASNLGGWLWCTGDLDGMPYFRVFNPWRQAAEYDPQAIYIRQWVSEFANVPAKDIHLWNDPSIRAKYSIELVPIVDCSETAKLAVEQYKKAKIGAMYLTSK